MRRSWTELSAWRALGRPIRFVVAALALLVSSGAHASAGQIGALLSPGALSRPHKALEGTQCQKCHEAGQKVNPQRCLACHEPIAQRISARKGVHRQVVECVSCHVEHAGSEADLRPIDTRRFNHAAETGFPLTGVHAKVAGTCTACHKNRSYLDLKPACASCHADPHKGALGVQCASCHTLALPFKAARTSFDHGRARFPLSGAHKSTVQCEQCHRNGQFKGLSFASCTSCHTEPHDRKFGPTCTTCHTTGTWDTTIVEHGRTVFPLVGAHVRVSCTRCHTGERMTDALPHDTCASCHTNPHRESITGDCASCHSQNSFRGGTFDHSAKAGFALDGRHAGLACSKCHAGLSDGSVPLARRTADFSGASASCVSCHADRDPHKGAFGRACDSCHRPTGFAVKEFRHPRDPGFFGGQHTTVACEKCHVPDQAERPLKVTSPQMACVSCHADVHLGQMTATCDTCHRVDGVKFKALAFSHERARLPLRGSHEALDCAKCHVTETGAFPARSGTAVRFTPIEPACSTCHRDPHLGQFAASCETCHNPVSFTIAGTYTHRELKDFFAGFHRRYACRDCHKQERGTFPAGTGVATRYMVGRTCAACHPQY